MNKPPVRISRSFASILPWVWATAVVFAILIPLALKYRHDRSVQTQTYAQILPAPTPSVTEGFCKNPFYIVCKKRGLIEDPTGFVNSDVASELQSLRIYQALTQKHPDWDADTLNEELVKLLYTHKKTRLLKDTLALVQKQITQWIYSQKNLVFSASEKAMLAAQIRNVVLDLPPPASKYAATPDLIMKNDVLINREADGVYHLKVGGAFLISQRSHYNLIFTLAHEFGHLIEPCDLKSIPVIYNKLISCFQKMNWITVTPGKDLTCATHPIISEVFSDWLAVQITTAQLEKNSQHYPLTDLLYSAINSIKDLCDDDESFEELDLTLHPTPEIRIEKIFASYPKLRTLLDCPERPLRSYCELDRLR